MVESVWKPMDTAPKDGSLMWLDFGDGTLEIGRWFSRSGGFWRREFIIGPSGCNTPFYAERDEPPRAWMPLPLPPLVEDGDA